MNPLDHQLDRLLRSAAQSPRPVELNQLSFAAESRILAVWRTQQSDSLGWLANWLRAGLATAALVAAIALGLNWPTSRPPTGDEYAVANATFYVAVAP